MNLLSRWKKLKKKNSNLYLLIISIAMVMWFRGINGILANFTFNSINILVNIIWIGISLYIFYLDDGSIKELIGLHNTALGTVVTNN